MNDIRYLRAIILASTLFAALPLQGYADDIPACQDHIKECFAKAIDSREECLQSASTNPLCSNTPLGRLIEKRTQFSSIKQIDELEGPAFLGPQVVDKRCVDKFDTTWSAALIKGTLSSEAIGSLSHDLDSCSVSNAHQLPHP